MKDRSKVLSNMSKVRCGSHCSSLIIITILTFSFLLITSYFASAVTFSGSNVPFDSYFHLGLVNGPGTGVSIGAELFYPLQWAEVGLEVEQQITNTEFEQNLSILKYGIAGKLNVTDTLYLTASIGRASFYVTQALDYHDSFSGAEYTIDEDTHGGAAYITFAPNFLIGEFIVTPKAVVDNIDDGGSIFEFDLNIGHAF